MLQPWEITHCLIGCCPPTTFSGIVIPLLPGPHSAACLPLMLAQQLLHALISDDSYWCQVGHLTQTECISMAFDQSFPWVQSFPWLMTNTFSAIWRKLLWSLWEERSPGYEEIQRWGWIRVLTVSKVVVSPEGQVCPWSSPTWLFRSIPKYPFINSPYLHKHVWVGVC